MASDFPTGDDGMAGEILTDLGAGVLYLERFTIVERLSQPFTLTCEVLSLQLVDFTPYIGTPVAIRVQGEDLTARYFNGMLAEAIQADANDDTVRYVLTVRPWFWLTSLNKQSRIFQSLSSIAIIKQVFDGTGISADMIENRVRSSGAVVRNYCVQYDESDFNFVSRLMEEEGIYYFFAHSADKHVLTMCDGPPCHHDFTPDLPLNRENDAGWVQPHLNRWGAHVRQTASQVAMRDFHLRPWGETLDAQAAASSKTTVWSELFCYPGAYSHLTDDGQTTGAHFAATRLQAAQAEKLTYAGQGTTFAVPVGSFVSVQPAAGDTMDVAVKILVTGATHKFEGLKLSSKSGGDGVNMHIAIEGVPKDTTFRPPMRAVKPWARGPQVARVVGRSGEAIDPDPYGRVRVQFPWDRQHENNEQSSCWIRVSQGWAAKGFGMMHLPRIGDEVIVDFFDGDMDRPVITGRVYNSTNTTPYALPDEKTKSTWKSQTVGQLGEYPNTVDPPSPSDRGYNELRFEDKGGSEEVWMHAQRVFRAWYRFDEIRTTGRNTTISVGYNRDITIKNNETKTVQDGDETHTVSGRQPHDHDR